MTKFLQNKAIHEGTLLVQRAGALCIEESKGQMTAETPFAIASVSKLYTYALLFQLLDAGQLTYQTTLVQALPSDITRQLPQSDQITIQHLVDHTSGLANHEMDRQPDGTVLMNEVLQQDRPVPFDEALAIVARLPTVAPPGQKAYYADINAALLGMIAETLTGMSAQQLLAERVCRPLGLTQTHWADGDEAVAPIYHGVSAVICRQYLASQVYQGGIIATNRELMRFAQAFFGGELFDRSHIAQPAFRPIQFRPLRYGSGMMQLRIAPLVAPLFGGVREMRGHSGLTGSFAFYCPQNDVIVTGTTNQLKFRPYAMLARAIAAGTKQ